MLALAPAGPTTTPAPTTEPTPAPSTTTAKTVVLKVLSNKHVQSIAKRTVTVTAQLIVCMVVVGLVGMLAVVAWAVSTAWNGTTEITGALVTVDTEVEMLYWVFDPEEWVNQDNTIALWNNVGRLTERAIEWVIESAVVVRAIGRA